MITSHTPGPWVAQAGTTTGMEVIAPSAPKARRVVARCGGKDDRDANARLIAAAPDLLKALQSVEWAYDARDSEGGPSVWCCPFCDEQKEGGHLDECLIGAALAKAEGL